MEDDGLLLNFTTSARPSRPKTQVERPSWHAGDRTHKRGRDDHVGRPDSSSTRPQKRAKGTQKDAQRGSRKGGNEQDSIKQTGVVSSLFSFNPDVVAQESRTSDNLNEITNAPLRDSTSFSVNNQLAEFLKTKMGLETPTEIQARAVPAIAEARKTKKDVIMVAQTGSGKTFAYLLPILNDLMTTGERIDRTSGVFAVVLAPTRELASQIFQVCEALCRCCHYIVPGLVIGGEKKKSEKARLRKGVNILIGTPGRLADHVDNTERLALDKVKYVVLDEGDRLIDLGFEETLTQILTKITDRRITVLCSATMNAQASRLKTLALTEPVVWVREERKNEVEATPSQLVQRVVVVPAKLRLVSLAAVLRRLRAQAKKAIVFFSCTDSVDFHHQVFSAMMPTFKLHGNLSQQDRAVTMQNFSKSVKGGILLTTDVASRGLDVLVDAVVEYDPPFTIEDHLHRVGRTARAGRRGDATLFLLPSEEEYQQRLKEAHTYGFNVEGYQSVIKHGFSTGDWQEGATTWQLDIEKKVRADDDGFAELARKAYTSHIRAYTTHSHAEKHIFNFKNLHLGHLAKAFALRESPKALTGPSAAAPKPKKKSARDAMLEAAQKQLETGDYNIV